MSATARAAEASPHTDAQQRPLRADAQRNRDALLDAASAAFAENGVDTSLEDVAKVTKIQPRILDKLERGELEGLPADVFVRGFWNPWGHAFDRFGQSFITDGANGEGITYGVPGAYYPASQGPNAQRIMHGKTSLIHHTGLGVFAGLPNPFEATRYHSLVVEKSSLPGCLDVTAWTQHDDGSIDEIMGLRHRTLAVEGVQFHPESILTQHGHDLLRNFLVPQRLAA